ncbi:SH3 domain-containing protein [Constantimarinum furrinae]|uniref:SH3 domain-containing protein n=1 Tax=Constantimarinum furrinae TaxID=2562285 RepID=A0A7G8PRN9_9FLAO|nr:SH3 domain-containing protein [Constantimarinum furrinae]QNJ97005.1 hypothetical protein ALE3EI_0421 [Constantimarinum furrinae]
MSEKLRELIEGYTNNDPKFFRTEDGRMMERTEDGEDVFTGYFQDSEGKFYTAVAWEEELRKLYRETQDIRAEKQRKAEAERQEVLADRKREEEKNSSLETKPTKKPKVLIFVIAVVLLVLLIFAVYSWNDTEEQRVDHNSPDTTEIPTKISDMDTVFGDAIITGSSVRLRKNPSTAAAIISVFEEEGERVQRLTPDTLVKEWKYVQRKNGEQGWVFSAYVNDSITPR